MTAHVFRLPDQHQDFAAAREALHSRAATRDQIIMACDVLAQSRDYMDLRLVSDMRNALWADHRSDLRPEHRVIAERLSIGVNAPLFEAMNRRRQFDRRMMVLAAIATLGLLAVAVL